MGCGSSAAGPKELAKLKYQAEVEAKQLRRQMFNILSRFRRGVIAAELHCLVGAAQENEHLETTFIHEPPRDLSTISLPTLTEHSVKVFEMQAAAPAKILAKHDGGSISTAMESDPVVQKWKSKVDKASHAATLYDRNVEAEVFIPVDKQLVAVVIDEILPDEVNDEGQGQQSFSGVDSGKTNNPSAARSQQTPPIPAPAATQPQESSKDPLTFEKDDGMSELELFEQIAQGRSTATIKTGRSTRTGRYSVRGEDEGAYTITEPDSEKMKSRFETVRKKALLNGIRGDVPPAKCLRYHTNFGASQFEKLMNVPASFAESGVFYPNLNQSNNSCDGEAETVQPDEDEVAFVLASKALSSSEHGLAGVPSFAAPEAETTSVAPPRAARTSSPRASDSFSVYVGPLSDNWIAWNVFFKSVDPMHFDSGMKNLVRNRASDREEYFASYTKQMGCKKISPNSSSPASVGSNIPTILVAPDCAGRKGSILKCVVLHNIIVDENTSQIERMRALSGVMMLRSSNFLCSLQELSEVKREDPGFYHTTLGWSVVKKWSTSVVPWLITQFRTQETDLEPLPSYESSGGIIEVVGHSSTTSNPHLSPSTNQLRRPAKSISGSTSASYSIANRSLGGAPQGAPRSPTIVQVPMPVTASDHGEPNANLTEEATLSMLQGFE